MSVEMGRHAQEALSTLVDLWNIALRRDDMAWHLHHDLRAQGFYHGITALWIGRERGYVYLPLDVVLRGDLREEGV